MRTSRRPFCRSLYVKLRLLLIALMVAMMALPISSTQAESVGAQVRQALGESIELLHRDTRASGKLERPGIPLPQQVESPAERETRVAYIRLCPRKLLLYVGEAFTLAAMPIDSNKEAVHGINLAWETADAKVAQITSWGEVSAIASGVTAVTVRAGVKRANVLVEVREGVRPRQSDEQWDADHANDCTNPEATALNVRQPETREVVATAAETPERNESDDIAYQRVAARDLSRSIQPASLYVPTAKLRGSINAATGKSSTGAAPFQPEPILDGDGNDTIATQAANFRNALGSPRFSPQETTENSSTKTKKNLGSYNYLFTVPVVGLGGRGQGVGLAMTYNSRVWNKDDFTMTFNYNKGWPAPGWTLGYGRIIRNYDGTAGGQNNNPGNNLLIQPDGTRVHLQASLSGNVWEHDSKDGTFLHLSSSNKLKYPDGTQIKYDEPNGRLVPTSIKTKNGALVTIAYRQHSASFKYRWAIDSIRDTLGRFIRFRYYGDPNYPADSANGKPLNALAAITAPDFAGGASERLLVRIQYQTVTLSYNFNNTVIAPASGSLLWVVKRIYYPQTGQGYLMLDYSSYAMARYISVRKDMTGAGGAITDGTEIAYTKYNYVDINTQVGALDDSPQYTKQSEWWQDKTDDNGNPDNLPTEYNFSRQLTTDINGLSIEIDKTVHPTGLEVWTTTGDDSIKSPDTSGKVVTLEHRSGTTVLRKMVQTYISGGTQVESVEIFDENNQPTKVGYAYGSFGRVKNVYEYGYKASGNYAVRRRTFLKYADDQDYLNENMIQMVNEIRIFDGGPDNDDNNDTLLAKVVYSYDEYFRKGGMETYGLTPATYPPNHDSAYDQNKTKRGNITGVQTWINIALDTSTTRYSKYDIFGNVVAADVSCCVETAYTFSGVTYYSQPDLIRKGSSSGPNLSSLYLYNFSTGLVTQQQDSDGLFKTFEYDDAWRLSQVNLPTGAAVKTKFDKDPYGNDQLSYNEETFYKEDGEDRLIASKSWFDGAGRVLRAGVLDKRVWFWGKLVPAAYDLVATVYDRLGRVKRQSNPYVGDGSGMGSPQDWTTNTYDLLSRVTEITLPDHQQNQPSKIQNIYAGATSTAGATVTVIDQVGRSRKSEIDGLGRLVKVIEQNPSTGLLDAANYSTTYSYDVLDNLTGVDQTGQPRTFVYDALSRLVSETTPEAGTTTFTYTSFDAIQTRIDARNVSTTYGYDGLNRLQTVSYNTSGAQGVPPTTGVTISYRSTSPGKGQVQSISDAAGSESYSYDDVGRVGTRTRNIQGSNYVIGYEYNQVNQLSVLIYPSGKRMKAFHAINIGRGEGRGRMTGVAQVDTSGNIIKSYVSGITYSEADQVTGVEFGNGVTEAYTYNNRLQIATQNATKSGNTLMNLTYGYQAASGQMGTGTGAGNTGQVVTITGAINGQSRNQTFTYNNVGSLATATGTTWQRRYGYDRWGNRTGMWNSTVGGTQLQNIAIATTNGMFNNRIASVNAVSYNYDLSGNLLSDGANSYLYDAESRLVSVNNGTTASNLYDVANRRVKKVASGLTTNYIWEGGQVIAEYNGTTGALISEYVYAGSRMVAREQGGATRYFHQDRLSTRMMTDASGNVAGTQDHLPFGEDALTGAGENEKHRFTSYERETESNFDYAINRQHHYATGRFMQVDPIGGDITDPQSLNRYSYVVNDSINFIDPLGLKEISLGCDLTSQGCLACSYYDDETGDPRITVTCHGLPSIGPGGPPQPVGGGGSGRETRSLLEGGDGNTSSGEKKDCGISYWECYRDCVNSYRLDNTIRGLGQLAGHPEVGEFVADLTVTGTIASLVNGGLNLTSLGQKPRSGVGGGPTTAKGGPTNWIHRALGALGHKVNWPWLYRAAGRIGLRVNQASLVVLAFEGGHWQGVQAYCAAACANPENRKNP
jgi:RHS repeat-associated protein